MHNCHYCEGKSSPRNLLRICTLPGFDGVVNVCDLCFISDYEADKAAKTAVLVAEAMLAGENENEDFFTPLGKSLGWRAEFGLL